MPHVSLSPCYTDEKLVPRDGRQCRAPGSPGSFLKVISISQAMPEQPCGHSLQEGHEDAKQESAHGGSTPICPRATAC